MVTRRLARLVSSCRLWIDEPDVSLTDFGLALETGLFAMLLARRQASWNRLRWWGVGCFGAATVASLAGGTDHGFLRREGREAAHEAMWTVSLLAAGASSLALVGMGAELGLDRIAARRVRVVATGSTVAYAAAVLGGQRYFRVAILAYAPAATFLLGSFVKRRARGQPAGTLAGISAVTLAFAAVAVQQLRIGIHPDAFNHNALYHLIQAGSFAFLFVAIREIAGAPGEREMEP